MIVYPLVIFLLLLSSCASSHQKVIPRQSKIITNQQRLYQSGFYNNPYDLPPQSYFDSYDSDYHYVPPTNYSEGEHHHNPGGYGELKEEPDRH
jgi:hypothetical protein